MLRCWPFDQLPVKFVLIETNKKSRHGDLRHMDAFFSAHGFANVHTFLQTDGTFLDNLYMRIPGGKLVHPSGPTPACTEEDKNQTDCHGGGHWQDWPMPRLGTWQKSEWTRCPLQ